ncbi:MULTISPECIES: ABC transporter permease [unclassified Luteococcus]|uniref:ABC transporter permease n=1 Tax=unclassified Luteococcus TaxID=2639923 RepID=UPI00313BB929
MTGFTALLGKEFAEIRHSWRLWVLPGFVLLQAIVGPVTALFTKQLLGSMVSPEMAQTIPEPTYADAWVQWAKNLSPTVLLVVLVSAAGLVAGEVSKQTAVLVLTKPVSRRAFVLAKFVATLAFLIMVSVLGAAITGGLTALLFDGVHWAPLLSSTLVWLVLAAFYLAATLVASCLIDAPMGAAGAGLGVLLVVSVAGLWGPLARHTIAGLGGVMNRFAAGEQPAWGWPVATTVLLTCALVALAAELFTRREI